MDSYIWNNLAVAKELLETGVELQKPKDVLKALGIYSSLKSVAKDAAAQGNQKIHDNIVENVIRACSVLCVYDPKNAKNYLDEAAKYDDDNPVVNNNYGFVYHTQYGDWDKSITHYEKCLLKDPTYVTAYLGIIDVYRTLRHHKIELEYCKKGITNCPDSPEIYNSMGLAMLHNAMYSDMNAILSHFRKGLDLKPTDETKCKILVNIGHVYGITGEFSLAVDHYLQAISCDPKHHPAYQNILLNLHYFSDMDFNDRVLGAVMKKFNVTRNKGETVADVIHKLHLSIVETVYGTRKEGEPNGKVIFPNAKPVKDFSPTRKISIAYISADLVDHAVSFFSKVLFSNYNKDVFDVYIYANNVYDPDSIARLECTGYRCVQNASTADVCAQLEKDKVDILIDLSSHTSGNRLDVVAARPVPIVLSYLGYPADTGFPFVRRISDQFTELCNNRKFEKGDKTAPIRMERLFLCYKGKECMENNVKSYTGFKPKTSMVNFGCFAKLQKINSHVISAWMEILHRVPNGRLILKSRYFADKKIVDIWKKKFIKDGKDYSKRVLFLKGTTTAEGHMELYKMIDIHLDTFPYSGTTITTESLYMNVPVITLALYARSVGHVNRVSGSILQSLGLYDHCVASNINEYVSKAVDMVHKLPNFPSVRKKFLTSEISDPGNFMKHFQKALVNVFLEYGSENNRDSENSSPVVSKLI